MRPRRIYAGACAALAALAIAVLGGCSNYNEKRGIADAPVQRPTDRTPARVVSFPDGFSNVAFKCLGPNGIYVVTSDAAPHQIVPNDPNCAAAPRG